ncbi:MAG: hypothetical protein ACYTDX_06415 [Planctomycetota bacterium]
MSDATGPDLDIEPPSDRPTREEGPPWWAGLMGVGSVGIGGLQAIVGALLSVVGIAGPEGSRGIFLLLGLAWLIPGLMVAAGGVGVVLKRRWGRRLSIAAAVVGILMLVGVIINRSKIPQGILSLYEYAEKQEDVSPEMKKFREQMTKGQNRENMELMRSPQHQAWFGGVFAGYCCIPVGPWYLTLLFALVPPWGRRVVREDE